MTVFVNQFWKAFRDFDLEGRASNISFVRDREFQGMFLSLLALNIFTYFIFIAHQPLHNHGMNLWTDWIDQIWIGRWFNHFMMRVNHAANIPVFLPVFSGAISSLTGIFLLKLWRLRLTRLETFLVAGLVSTYPAFLAYYYYTWLTPLLMIGSFFAVISLYVCQRFHWSHIGLSGFFFMLMMASYQATLSVFATVAVSCVMFDLLRVPSLPLGEIFKTVLARGISAVIGGIAYILSLKILQISTSHATKPLPLDQLPQRIVEVIEASFRQLTVTQPELFTPIKLVLIVILIIAIVGSLYLARKSPFRIVLVVCCWPIAIIAVKTMFLVSADNNFFQYRYNVSAAFFHAFTAALALHAATFKPFRSLCLVIVSFVLLRFVQADLIRQEILLRGQMHDMAIANRILAAIEALPEIDFEKTYDFVKIGKYSTYRMDRLKSRGRSYEVLGDGHMDNGDITDSWMDEDIYVLLGAKIKFKYNHTHDPKFQQKLTFARQNLISGRKPWPHKDAVFIHDDTIYVYMR